MYVIQRKSDGKYVTPPGGVWSYTSRLEDAWTFATEEEARKNACPGNERVIQLPVNNPARSRYIR